MLTNADKEKAERQAIYKVLLETGDLTKRLLRPAAYKNKKKYTRKAKHTKKRFG